MTLAVVSSRESGDQDFPMLPVTFYKALGDELRLTILRLLKSESFGVLELCNILGCKQSALSHHLKILANAALVATRKEGNSIFYRRSFLLDSDPLIEAKESIFKNLDSYPLSPELLNKIKRIELERSAISRNFFNKNLSRFRENQDLITRLPEYEAALFELIDSLKLDADTSVIEIGPGEGELLNRLAQGYKQLVAIDISEEMIERARQALTENGFDNVDFILGDAKLAKNKGIKGKLVLINMVLHHIPSPAATFEDAFSLLEPGGALLVVDLCNHNQDWVRESCGDLWLGFESEELALWATQAGLREGQSLFLGLRNGFQIQMKLFHKPTNNNNPLTEISA